MDSNVRLIVDFLNWAIEDNNYISGDWDGKAGPSYESDTYETIAEKFIGLYNSDKQ